MYLQITTRCNMRCAHCCMAATRRGEDMSLETFKQAITHDDHIVLGGGEPTIHPLFEKFLFLALGRPHLEYLWLATNGSQTEISITLANMARRGILGCDLSRDRWHDDIDPRVVEAFTIKGRKDSDNRNIRNVEDRGSVIYAGRAARRDFDGETRKECPCEGPFVKPNGDVHQCGCKGSPKVGDVFSSFRGLGTDNDWCCFRSLEKGA